MQLILADLDEEHGMYCINGCGVRVADARVALGYRVCRTCGDAHARLVKHTVVPVPKSNYVYAHSINDVISPYSHKGNG